MIKTIWLILPHNKHKTHSPRDVLHVWLSSLHCDSSEQWHFNTIAKLCSAKVCLYANGLAFVRGYQWSVTIRHGFQYLGGITYGVITFCFVLTNEWKLVAAYKADQMQDPRDITRSGTTLAMRPSKLNRFHWEWDTRMSLILSLEKSHR